MSEPQKPKGTVRVYYVFPPKGFETSPNQVTLEDVKKYFSKKPLRRGPDREGGTNTGDEPKTTDPRPEGDKPNDPGTT